MRYNLSLLTKLKLNTWFNNEQKGFKINDKASAEILEEKKENGLIKLINIPSQGNSKFDHAFRR